MIEILNQYKWWIIMIVIILLGVSAVGGYMWFNKKPGNTMFRISYASN